MFGGVAAPFEADGACRPAPLGLAAAGAVEGGAWRLGGAAGLLRMAPQTRGGRYGCYITALTAVPALTGGASRRATSPVQAAVGCDGQACLIPRLGVACAPPALGACSTLAPLACPYHARMRRAGPLLSTAPPAAASQPPTRRAPSSLRSILPTSSPPLMRRAAAAAARPTWSRVRGGWCCWLGWCWVKLGSVYCANWFPPRMARRHFCAAPLRPSLPPQTARAGTSTRTTRRKRMSWRRPRRTWWSRSRSWRRRWGWWTAARAPWCAALGTLGWRLLHLLGWLAGCLRDLRPGCPSARRPMTGSCWRHRAPELATPLRSSLPPLPPCRTRGTRRMRRGWAWATAPRRQTWRRAGLAVFHWRRLLAGAACSTPRRAPLRACASNPPCSRSPCSCNSASA